MRRRGVAIVGLLLAGLAGAYWTRSGRAAPPYGPPGLGEAGQAMPRPQAARPPKADAGPPALPVTAADDCPAICTKLLRCKHGPWDTEDDCREACEGAIEDAVSSKTYRCAAQATTCAKVKRCGR